MVEIRTPIDVRERLVFTGIGFTLSALSFLILNPFFAILILSFYALFVYDSVKQIKLTLFMFAFAVAIFYASRNIWVWVGDDVPNYIQRYLQEQHDGFSSIVSRFILFPPTNEVLYYSFMWVIGNLFNLGTQTLIFIVHLGQLTLLSVAAYLVSKRYTVVFLFIFFFGITDPSPNFMHIWRATYGQLIFMIGTLIYFKGNPKTGRIIILASLGFHVTLILFIFIFELYIFLRRKTSYFTTVVLGGFAFYLSLSVLRIALEYIWPTKAGQFFNYPVEEYMENFTEVSVLIVLFAGNYFYKLSPVARFTTFSFLAYFVMVQGYSEISDVAGRYNQMAWGLVTIPFFEIVMKQSKVIIASVIILLFLRVKFQPLSEFLSLSLPEYRELFYGVANILVFK